MAKKNKEDETNDNVKDGTEAYPGNNVSPRQVLATLLTRVENIEQRIDRIVAALGKSKSVKGM